MNIIILTPVRLLGDGLAACFRNHSDSTTVVVVKDIGSVRDILASTQIDVVLVDVTQGVNLYDIRAIAAEWSSVPIVALGLAEQRQEVVKCGRAGFASYVARDASIDALYKALSDVAAGLLACPPEISGGLLRALFRREPHTAEEPTLNSALTHRECEVLDLVGRGSFEQGDRQRTLLERGDGQTSRPSCSREAQGVETGRGHAPGSRCALARPHRVNREGNKRAAAIIERLGTICCYFAYSLSPTIVSALLNSGKKSSSVGVPVSPATSRVTPRSTRSTRPCRTSLPAAWRARRRFQGACCALCFVGNPILPRNPPSILL